MNLHHSNHRRQTMGFTLIEMLVVIAIIAILAAIALTAFSSAKTKAKIAVAKIEISHLVTAIHQYESEYKRPPSSKAAFDSTTTSSPDFTFGTVTTNGTAIAGPTIINKGNNGYQNANSEVMAILMDLDVYPNVGHARNPGRLSLFSAKSVETTTSPGLGPDTVFRDPWGSPYIITIDLNEDNKCQDGFYYPLTKGPKPWLIPGSVMVWSFGPDASVDQSKGANPRRGANKDNILSWE